MRLIDADALCEYVNNQKDKTISANDIMRFPTIQPDAPRVTTLEEVWSLPEGSVVWFEERDNGGRTYIQPMMSNGKAFMIGTQLDINVSRGSLNWAGRRFWTSRPTEEQREATPWID